MKNLLYMLTALAIGIGLAPYASSEPGNGEQRCGPDGSVMRFDAETHSWRRTVAPCDPVTVAQPDRGLEPRSPPSEGDAKCGPDGYVLRYSTEERAWVQSVARCQ
jgi:hypothetical protein